MKFLIANLLFLIWASSAFAQVSTIRVLDRATGDPIIQAHVKSGEETVIATTDTDGFVSINRDDHPVIILTAVGYKTREFMLRPGMETLYMNPEIYRNETGLLVLANREGENNVQAYQQQHHAQNMDQFLDKIDGVSTNKRGAFAWEPVIRGQSDQRMNLMIDGMQVFKACVDKMDPITSYVESSNLSELHIDKSGSDVASSGGGNSSINLITRRAEPESFSMNVSTGYRLPDNYRTLSVAGNTSDRTGRHAVRFSGSYKKADDFVSGNGTQINNSQYEKLNLNVSYRHRLPSNHIVEANYITDKAYDVGYPALLMDATKALADIGQVRFNFAPTDRSWRVETIQIYANAIRHTMDDYSRDVENRDVMGGMHMPMFGETFTAGTRVNGQAEIARHSFEWFLEGYNSRAYGDMEMNSLDPNIEDMFIYNLQDVTTWQGNIGLKHRFMISDDLLLKAEQNIALKNLDTGSERFASFFEGLYNRELNTRPNILLSASGNLLWMPFDDWSFSGSLVYSERMGNHMERFGHYIYNYTDGYFYDGNPWLKTERAINTDLNTTWETDSHSISLSLFHKQYYNYIDGILSETTGNTGLEFKRYENVGDATITGGEFRSLNRLGHLLSVENRVSYLYARNQTLGEPLPLIPPIKGFSTLHLHFGENRLMGELEWAAAQKRIAQTASIEDVTGSFAVLNLTWEREWLNGSLTSILRASNLLDRYYHTHTSIGNIPEAGRSIMVSFSYAF
ncbi:TonB-dependent receptor domain-containing protein [Rhodohalobacter sp.]|uniref:TonB-dependent receptor domain-containing protein n=1 Tax=Rhodohalobacter sp. TaxID=1974210 RepID=UPI002ACDEFEE|nr:TonB-dependent receptor [Rhodohalobacter sp.]MDZ7757292.1 TonB-dependent receptor [Rhodohalobacter sp.]